MCHRTGGGGDTFSFLLVASPRVQFAVKGCGRKLLLRRREVTIGTVSSDSGFKLKDLHFFSVPASVSVALFFLPFFLPCKVRTPIYLFQVLEESL